MDSKAMGSIQILILPCNYIFLKQKKKDQGQMYMTL